MKLSKILLSALVLCIQIATFGQTKTITFNNVPSNISCNEVWTEQNLNLSFVATTEDDCGPGACYFGIDSSCVWLFPSRLTIDVSSLKNIQKVEVDIIDGCGINCTRAFLMDSIGMIIDSTGNKLIGIPETFTLLNPTEGSVKEIAISSCEGQADEVRIYQNTTGIIETASDSKVLTIYPNPSTSNDDLHFKISSPTNFPTKMNIFSINGKLIYSQEIDTNTRSLIIPAQTLSKGVFFVQFKIENSFVTQKIVRL